MIKYNRSVDALHKNLPALDGLRAISILLVVFSHAGMQHIVPGGAGVIVFFVISGFLITRLMLEEVAKTGSLNIRLFYIRRFLRLMPTILIFLVLFVPIFIYLGAQITVVQITSVLLYFANYYHIYVEYPNHSAFPIFWSLSVEEHFYIIFPFIFFLLCKRLKLLLGILAIAVLFILAWRMYLVGLCLNGSGLYNLCGVKSQLGDRIFHGTDSISDSILYGVITSLVLAVYERKFLKLLLNNTAFYLSLTGLFLSLGYRNEFFRETFRYSLQAISVSVFLVNLLYGRAPSFKRILENAILVSIGRWSYALYIFHYGVADLMGIIYGDGWEPRFGWGMVIYLAASFALAGLVYRFIEKPMQKVRSKFHALSAVTT